jgi:GNAT superfamily N-acetyltransferase
VPVTLRPATTADAERLGHAVADGMDLYRSFAPEGWAPAPARVEVEHLDHLLADPQVWCRLAESEGDVVGQVTVLPAAIAAHPVDDPALAHLRNLFVRSDHWGTGLASSLHAAAIEAARERGYAAVRLFSAAGQARARHFYEREGWVAAGDEFHDPVAGLVMVEYRLTLS